MALGSSPVRQIAGFRFPAQIIGISAEGKAALEDESVTPATLNNITRPDIERYIVALAQRAPTTNVTTAINALKALLLSTDADEGAGLIGIEDGTASHLDDAATVQELVTFLDTAFTPAANVAEIGNSATGTQIATAVNGIIAILIAKGLMDAP